jgi:hypothetical protein
MKPIELKARLDLIDGAKGTAEEKAKAKRLVYGVAAFQAFIVLALVVWIGQAVIRATFFS